MRISVSKSLKQVKLLSALRFYKAIQGKKDIIECKFYDVDWKVILENNFDIQNSLNNLPWGETIFKMCIDSEKNDEKHDFEL